MKEDLAAIIRRMRNDHGMTQRELADKIGVTAQAVSKWERAEAYPDILLLPVLASLFDVSIDDLMGYRRGSELSKLNHQNLAIHLQK